MSGHHHHISGKNLFVTIILNLFITIAQVIGGLFSGSLALLSDALHNFSDVLALAIAYFAHGLTHRAADYKKTFGYKRAEIMAAFFNTSILMLIACYLVYEAVLKLIQPQEIDSIIVIWLGVLSIFLNALSVLLLKSDAQHSLNMKAAYLHLLSDMVTSVAVVFGGMIIYYFHILWIDPLLSMLIALYLIIVSWGLLRNALAILMQFAPDEIDLKVMIDGVKTISPLLLDMHHVHLWQLDEHHIHLEAHLSFSKNITLQESDEVLNRLESYFKDEFGITHTTFQCEFDRCNAKNSLCLVG